jgi:nucleoside-diphosphate-sugar epimerase
MTAFVTGATGFLGGRLVEKLRERGDEVTCLVRSPEKAARLQELGARLVAGDLADTDAIRTGVEGATVVYHAAADYRVGVHDSVLEQMRDTNVRGTERVIDAAHVAAVEKIVYVSTVNVYGDTHGQVADEETPHRASGFASKYEQTKVEAHAAALAKVRTGAPVVIVQPGTIYGPGDPSAMGTQLRGAAAGKLPGIAFPQFGMNFVHVDDVADGLIAAAERGEPGASYILGGDNLPFREAIETAAEAGGKKPPKITMPTPVIKALAPIPGVPKLLSMPPNAKEVIRVMDGTTLFASSDRAKRDLGYAPRDVKAGFRETFGR